MIYSFELDVVLWMFPLCWVFGVALVPGLAVALKLGGLAFVVLAQPISIFYIITDNVVAKVEGVLSKGTVKPKAGQRDIQSILIWTNEQFKIMLWDQLSEPGQARLTCCCQRLGYSACWRWNRSCSFNNTTTFRMWKCFRRTGGAGFPVALGGWGRPGGSGWKPGPENSRILHYFLFWYLWTFM